MENEIWKDITNYKGLYQISNYGRVKSLKRKCKAIYGERKYLGLFYTKEEAIDAYNKFLKENNISNKYA